MKTSISKFKPKDEIYVDDSNGRLVKIEVRKVTRAGVQLAVTRMEGCKIEMNRLSRKSKK